MKKEKLKTQKSTIPEPRERAAKTKVRYENPILDLIIIRRYGYRKATIDSFTDIVLLYSVCTTCYFIAFDFPGEDMAIADGVC